MKDRGIDFICICLTPGTSIAQSSFAQNIHWNKAHRVSALKHHHCNSYRQNLNSSHGVARKVDRNMCTSRAANWETCLAGIHLVISGDLPKCQLHPGSFAKNKHFLCGYLKNIFSAGFYCSQATVKIRTKIKNPKNDRGYEMATLELLEPYDVIRYLMMDVKVDIPEAKWTNIGITGEQLGLNGHCILVRAVLTFLWVCTETLLVRQPAFGEVQKVLGIFVSLPLFRPRSIRMSRWLLFSIDEKLLYQNVTLHSVLRRIVWSVNLLFEGVYPASGPFGEEFDPKLSGKPICGGKRFAVTELRGDQLWHKQVWQHKASWKGGVHESVCCQCDVRNRGHEAYFRIEDGDEIGREYSLLDFINEQLPLRNPCSSAGEITKYWSRF